MRAHTIPDSNAGDPCLTGPDPVHRFLNLLSNSFSDAQAVYSQGSCFQIWLLLRGVWPDAEPWYDQRAGHVYTKIGKRFYDIRGRCYPPMAHMILLTTEPGLFKSAFRWRWQGHLPSPRKLTFIQ